MSSTAQEPAKEKAAPSGKQQPAVPEKKPLKILMLHGTRLPFYAVTTQILHYDT